MIGLEIILEGYLNIDIEIVEKHGINEYQNKSEFLEFFIPILDDIIESRVRIINFLVSWNH